MDRKIVMLLIGIVAIGMFALPSTLAMYTGQHNISTGENVDCSKCHGAATSDTVAAELLGSGIHVGFTCRNCHGFATGSLDTPNGASNGLMGHAASTGVNCIGCHAESATFGDTAGLDTDGITVSAELSNGPHAALEATPIGNDIDKTCIACHTTVPVSGTIGGVNASSIAIGTYTYSGTV